MQLYRATAAGMSRGNRDARWVSGRVLRKEAAAILAAASRLGPELERAADLLAAASGKVLASGVGKSGLVARKLAATLSSGGAPAVFLHALEALHGDAGVCQRGDAAILVSKSGTTGELLALASLLRELGCPLVGILGNPRSPLAREVDIVLDASVRAEADPWNLLPTASVAVAMATGDALAVAVLAARGFTPEGFLRFHPCGQLGRNLRHTVAEAMHRGEEVAWVHPDTPLKHVVIAMTERPLGAACVIGEDGTLQGLITDGDLRRALLAHDDIRGLRAADIMTRTPVTVPPEARLAEALSLMEDRPSQISVLPVVNPGDGVCLGLLRLHDIYQAGMRS